MNRIRHHFAHVDRLQSHLKSVTPRQHVEAVRRASNDAREQAQRWAAVGASVLLSALVLGLALCWACLAGRE